MRSENDYQPMIVGSTALGESLNHAVGTKGWKITARLIFSYRKHASRLLPQPLLGFGVGVGGGVAVGLGGVGVGGVGVDVGAGTGGGGWIGFVGITGGRSLMPIWFGLASTASPVATAASTAAEMALADAGTAEETLWAIWSAAEGTAFEALAAICTAAPGVAVATAAATAAA